jgi:hypothetical protein
MTDVREAEELDGTEHVDPGEAREAAERAITPSLLLDGENPESREQVDAEHWIAAYSELISYKEALLITSAHQRASMENPSALAEAGGVDVVILKRELENCRRRLAFWLLRLDEIKAG